jgi:hypothetical protein
MTEQWTKSLSELAVDIAQHPTLEHGLLLKKICKKMKDSLESNEKVKNWNL